MTIRRATHTDLEPLMQMIRKVVQKMLAGGNNQWDTDYPNTEVFTRDVELNQLWLAEAADGAIAGVIAITRDREPEYADVPGWDTSEPALILHRLAVSPDHQGMGIAARLLHQAEAEALKHGIPRIFLDTNVINHPMQNLAMKLGYQFAGEIGLIRRPHLRFMCYEKRVALQS